MSEFHVQVVKVAKVGKHPNADTLSITQVNGRYPVVIKTGDFQEGDLAVHIPPDALVPVDRPEFAFLAPKATDGYARVKFSKIRGVPSYGFLIPPPHSLIDHYGVKKYEGPEEMLTGKSGTIRGPSVPYYDIEGLRKHEQLIPEGEEVVITEKIHGSQGKWTYVDGKLYCGSRNLFREDSVWNRMAEKYRLEAVLKDEPGVTLYGEVYGKGIQDLTYDLDEVRVAFFDAYSETEGWLNYGSFRLLCLVYNLPIVPVLYRGPFNLDLAYQLAEGKSTIASHVREGIVVKPVHERTAKIGRVFLKLPGQGYLLRKSA